MQLGIGKTMFPSWTAAVTLIKDHGTAAAGHAAAAVRAGDGSTRLDHAVRALTSFDHAIDNTRKLPVDWFVRGVDKYYRGYEVARQAVNLLVGSGLIPGARERVGRVSLQAAKDAFVAGVDVARTERGRFGRSLAGGWLEATAEDTVNGVALLGTTDTGRALLAGVNQVRAAVARGTALDAGLVQSVGALFDRAASQLLERERFQAQLPLQPVDEAAVAQAGELLAQVAGSAQELVDDAAALQARLDRMAG